MILNENEKIDKDKSAIALKYDVGDVAPTIVSTGQGYIAHKIIEQAKEDNVPLHKDSKLAKTLSNLEIGDTIPPELYSAVAEILVFVDEMEKLKAKLDKA